MVAFRSAVSVDASNRIGGADVSYPAGIQAGDLLLLVAHCAPQTSLDLWSPGAGWTLLHTAETASGSVEQGRASVWRRIATGSESGTVNVSSGGLGIAELRATMVAYSGVDTTNPLDGHAFYPGSGFGQTFIDAPALTTTDASFLVRYFSVTATSTLTTPANVTQRVYQTLSVGMLWGDEQGVAGSNPLRRSNTSNGSNSRVGYTIAIRSSNEPPNAPIPLGPADGSNVNRDSTQRFDWDFSDDNVGDSQSAKNFRYRATGAATWTETGWVASTDTYHDVAGGTFTDGVVYEWQAATKDAQGEPGPWSSSWFFTASTAPGAPTITAPANGATFAYTETVEWSTPDQDAYQIRVLDEADAVVSDTGAVTNESTRSAIVTFPTNSVARTIQVRVQVDSLWGGWAEVTGTVSWLAPPTPTVTLYEDATRGRMLVEIVNPAPSGSEPAASYNDVYVTDPGEDEERKATLVTPNSTWTYHLPPSGFDGITVGSVRVVAVAENGVEASSEATNSGGEAVYYATY